MPSFYHLNVTELAVITNMLKNYYVNKTQFSEHFAGNIMLF